MRFKDYITEAYDEHFDENDFERECKYYLNMMEGSEKYLYHGTTAPIVSGARCNFVPRGKPRNSSTRLHNEVNDFFESRFKLPFRDGLFVSGNSRKVLEYGSPSIIVPRGKFEWLCSMRIMDLYTTFERFYDQDWDEEDVESEGDRKSNSERNQIAEDKTIDLVKTSKWINNKNLLKCVESGNEIMLWCPNGFYTFTFKTLPSSMK